MSSSVAADRDQVEQLREWLRYQTVGTDHPTRVEARQDEDAEGRAAWYLVVTLPVPRGSDTWPVDGVAELDRKTRDKALELGVPWPWYVVIRPDEDEAAADEDDESQSGE
jgi:hypothetical protein